MKRSDITRQNILQAAEQEFSCLGLHGARVDKIALRAGANKRMIYAYFGGKEGLYSQVLDTVYARLGQLEARLAFQESSPRQAIEGIIREYFDFLQQNPSFVNLVIWENLNKGEYLTNSDVAKNKRMGLDSIRKLLQKGIASGEFRKDIDIEQTILSLNLFCFSCFSNRFTLDSVFGISLTQVQVLEERKKHLIQVVLRYLEVKDY